MKEYEIEVTAARKRFADVLNTAAYEGGRVIICRRDQMICALISIRDLRRLRELPPEPDKFAEAERAWQEGKRALEERLAREVAERQARLRANENAESGDG
ncbi:MAG TPA: type II toxin-antitoxin system prevent-host-death family antitoxin [Myxococcales bacterium]|nr:type II toxin-antitoxin system prevent-host-death family antitoxin [Myxococcales bacterium]